MTVVQHLGEKLEIKQAAPRFPALGLAMYYLCHRKPFSDMSSSAIIPVVDGQIRRGHALIAMQGPRAVGYLGYGAASWFEPVLGDLGTGADGADDAGFMLFDTVLAFDHVQHRILLISNARISGDDDLESLYQFLPIADGALSK